MWLLLGKKVIDYATLANNGKISTGKLEQFTNTHRNIPLFLIFQLYFVTVDVKTIRHMVEKHRLTVSGVYSTAKTLN